jgi:hypothetical protein
MFTIGASSEMMRNRGLHFTGAIYWAPGQHKSGGCIQKRWIPPILRVEADALAAAGY